MDHTRRGTISIFPRYCFVEWKMHDFFTRPPSASETWQSPTFVFWETTFYLELCTTTEKNRPTHTSIGLFLVKEESETENFDFHLGLKAGDGSVYRSLDGKCSAIFGRGGHYKLLQKSEVLKDQEEIALNGVVTFFCEVHLPGEGNKVDAQCQTDDNGIEVFHRNIESLFTNEKMTDVTINVENSELKAHKCILAARSSVFETMFQHNMKESNTSIIDIEDSDADTFKSFLHYLYTAKMDQMSTEKAVSLYPVADKYDVKPLAECCLDIATNNISVDAFCDIITLALNYKLPELVKASEEYFAEHANEILVTLKWQTFLKENATAANELFINCFRKLKS